MRKNIIRSFAVVILFLGLAVPSMAKDLTNRISLGYARQLGFMVIGGEDSDLTNTFLGIDCASTKYWATENIGMEFMVGYFTAKYEEVGGWALDIGGKFLYNIIKEDNLNIYSGAGVGIIPVHVDYGREELNETGFQFMGFGGVEFFFQGLPNLGFDMEIGLQYIDIDEYAQLSTYGGAFSTFGIRYYF